MRRNINKKCSDAEKIYVCGFRLILLKDKEDVHTSSLFAVLI